MSHKQAKIARRAVRATGKDPRNAINTAQPFHMPSFPPGIGPGCMFHPRTLAVDCGRAIYRAEKARMAKA